MMFYKRYRRDIEEEEEDIVQYYTYNTGWCRQGRNTNRKSKPVGRMRGGRWRAARPSVDARRAAPRQREAALLLGSAAHRPRAARRASRASRKKPARAPELRPAPPPPPAPRARLLMFDMLRRARVVAVGEAAYIDIDAAGGVRLLRRRRRSCARRRSGSGAPCMLRARRARQAGAGEARCCCRRAHPGEAREEADGAGAKRRAMSRRAAQAMPRAARCPPDDAKNITHRKSAHNIVCLLITLGVELEYNRYS